MIGENGIEGACTPFLLTSDYERKGPGPTLTRGVGDEGSQIPNELYIGSLKRGY